MSKLTEFYNIKSQVFDGEDSTRWDVVEEKLIREELLPELMALVKPVLAQVKSPLSLNISYDPNGNLAITATRNCIQAVETLHPVKKTVESEYTAEVEPPSVAYEPAPVIQEGPDVVEEEREPLPTPEIDENEVTEGTDKPKITRSKSVAFAVTFADGTTICEKNGAKTFVKALQHIGLERIANGNHGVSHAGFNVVDTRKRESDAKKQEPVDGYYVYTHMSHEDKMDDLRDLADYFGIGIEISTLNVEETPTKVSSDVEVEQQPIESANEVVDKSFKEQFRIYLLEAVKESTANSYVSTLENIVSEFVHSEVDAEAEGIFSFTNPEDLEICIEILKESEAFIEENKRKHNSMTAALNLYYSFIKGRK